MKKIFLSIIALLGMVSTYAKDRLVADEVYIEQGGKAKIAISFDGDATQFCGGQLDLVLQNGFTSLIDDTSLKNDVRGSVFDDHTIDAGTPRGTVNTYRYLFTSNYNKAFKQSTGTMLTPVIEVGSDVPVGDYEALVNNIILVYKTDQIYTTGEYLDSLYVPIHVVAPGTLQVVLDENSTTAPSASKGPVNVIVNRTIKANTWSTIVLPFALSGEQVKENFGDDVLISDYSGWSDEYANDEDENPSSITVNFTRVNATTVGIEANHPYIIKTTKDISAISANGVTISPEDEPSVTTGSKRKHDIGSFIGNYVADFTVPEENLFISDNEFWYSVGKTKMKAFRAYFEFADVLQSYYDDTSKAKINFGFNDATGINSVRNDAATTGDIYDMQGRKIANGTSTKQLPHGIYIRNGKKFVVK